MQLRTEIEIDAPPDRIWEVLTDLAAYPEWNPFVVSASGQLAPGERLRITLGFGDGRESRVQPTVLKVEPPTELRWRARFFIKGLFDGEHFFRLIPIDAERTRFVHGEDFSGILVQTMGRRLTETARGCVGMNKALKRRVEGA